MIRISEWHDIALLTINLVSLVCIFYTITLIIWITPKSMSEYRWFLLLYTSADAAFTFLFGIILFPKFIFPSTCCIVQGLGIELYFMVKHFLGEEGGDFMLRMGVLGTTWFMVNIFTTQDYCLIYRFTIVHPNQKYHDILVNKKYVCCAVTIATLLCFAFIVPCFQTIPGAKEIRILMKNHELKFPGLFDEVASDAVILWLKEDSQPIAWFFSLIFVGFIISEFVAISSVFFILKILRKNASSFSAQTYNLHRQMTILLIIQIVNPLIFIIIPIISCVIAVIYKIEFQRMTGVYGVLYISFYSISNTILTVIFVSPYRKFTTKYIIKIWSKLPFLKRYQAAVAPIAIIQSTSGGSFQLNRNQ